MMASFKRLSQSVAVFCAFAVFTVVFQNCGQYQPAEMENLASNLRGCTGSDCPSNPEAILLSVGNADPEILLRTDTAFDVGGYCDPANYPKNKIVWQLNGPTPVGPIELNDACDSLGRYRIRINLAQGHNHDQPYTLVVQLVAVDANGGLVNNPLGLHRRELTVRSVAAGATQ